MSETQMKQAQSLFKVDTLYSADCIEWCPFEGARDIFVCGTYQVLEPAASPNPLEDQEKNGLNDDNDDDEEIEQAPKQTQRTGRLLVFKVNEQSGQAAEIQRIDTPAILDAKWSPRLDQAGRPILAVGDAKGHITTYTLDVSSGQLSLVQSIDVEEETILCLSLDFSHRLQETAAAQIVTSLSNGSLAILSQGNQERYEVVDKWRAHDFEPWCATWDNWDVNTIWSGGDDLKMKRWDVRDTSHPTMTNKRFDAGVTTITSSPFTEHLLAVGSYDENLRIFDARSPLRPLRTIPLGGGIWRARFHPSSTRSNTMLVACMHDGFKIVDLDKDLVENISAAGTTDDITGCEIVTRFDGHTSLAYGADWSRLGMEGGEESLIATCSFYDHTIHVWRA